MLNFWVSILDHFELSHVGGSEIGYDHTRVNGRLKYTNLKEIPNIAFQAAEDSSEFELLEISKIMPE